MSDIDPFRQLEKEVANVTRRLMKLISENRDLTERLQKVESQLEDTSRLQKEKDQLLNSLRSDRIAIRTSVLKIQEKLTALEEPMKESDK